MKHDQEEYERFKNLGFDKFRELAQDDSLNRYERIGFPSAYRDGYEAAIFADILQKLPRLQQSGLTILDIGTGCSDLPHMLIEHCRKQTHRLILIDSQEMLDQLPDAEFITKIAAYFPDEAEAFIEESESRIDVGLAYSVLHYVFEEGNLHAFFDQSLRLLRDGGQLLMGDIPNISKRKRFFSSPNGVKFHKDFMQTDAPPEVIPFAIEASSIDDGVLFGLMLRARNSGFDSYLLPQPDNLPMANRREDLLILKP